MISVKFDQIGKKFAAQAILSAGVLFTSSAVSSATQFILTVEGTDAIFLAGRTDITVPDPSAPMDGASWRVSQPTLRRNPRGSDGDIPVRDFGGWR